MSDNEAAEHRQRNLTDSGSSKMGAEGQGSEEASGLSLWTVLNKEGSLVWESECGRTGSWGLVREIKWSEKEVVSSPSASWKAEKQGH